MANSKAFTFMKTEREKNGLFTVLKIMKTYCNEKLV